MDIDYKKPLKKEKKDFVSQYVPWFEILEGNIIFNKDSTIQKSYDYTGPDLHASGNDYINLINERINHVMMNLSTGWTVWYELQRRQTCSYQGSTFNKQAAFLIDQEKKEKYELEANHYENHVYITFHYNPGIAGDLITRKLLSSNEIFKDKINYFLKIVDTIVNVLSSFAVIRPLNRVQTLSYLKSTINSYYHEIDIHGNIFIDKYLCVSPIHVGKVLQIGEVYSPIVSLFELPHESYPSMLEILNTLPASFRFCTRFICLSKADAGKALKKYSDTHYGNRYSLPQLIGQTFSKETPDRMNITAVDKEGQVNEAIMDLDRGYNSVGYYSATLQVFDSDYYRALEKMKDIEGILAARKFITKTSVDPVDFLFGSIPGNTVANVERTLISTGNFPHLVTTTGIWPGSKTNAKLFEWTGKHGAHIQCCSHARTPFYFNLNPAGSDVGHALVMGPTGAGKTMLLLYLGVSADKYDAQVIYFDMDAASRQTNMVCGGTFLEPGTCEFSFQPLRLIDESQEEFIFAIEFIELLLQAQNVNITPAGKQQITTALNILKLQAPCRRTISTFVQLVQNKEIKDALCDYTIEGVYSFFDSEEETMKDSNFITIEMKLIMNKHDKARIPAFFYLLHRVEQMFENQKFKILLLDEVWKLWGNPILLTKIDELLRTLRKKRVFVVCATQQISDLLNNPIFPTLMTNCMTKIYLPDHTAGSAVMRNIYKQLDLTDSEITLIKEAKWKKEYFVKTPDGCRLIDLELGKLAINLLSGMSQEDLIKISRESTKEDWLKAIIEKQGLEGTMEFLENRNLSTLKENN